MIAFILGIICLCFWVVVIAHVVGFLLLAAGFILYIILWVIIKILEGLAWLTCKLQTEQSKKTFDIESKLQALKSRKNS